MDLLTPHYRYLENYLFGMERDRERALDLVGETIARAWEAFDQLRDTGAFLSWILTIARRLVQEQGRREKIYHRDTTGYADQLRDDGSPPDLGPDIEALYRALDQLSGQQREAILLFEIIGLPLKEIIEVQGGTLGALKVRGGQR